VCDSILIVSTVQVFPSSTVVRPLESASLRARVLPNELSAESRVIVVDKYSKRSQQKLLKDRMRAYDEQRLYSDKHHPGIPRQFPSLELVRSLCVLAWASRLSRERGLTGGECGHHLPIDRHSLVILTCAFVVDVCLNQLPFHDMSRGRGMGLTVHSDPVARVRWDLLASQLRSY
jgi:hypothetical protein